MKRKSKTYELVRQLLEHYPEYRNNDKELHWKMFELQGYAKDGFLSKQGFLKAKSTETVRRTRQLVQANHPELRPNSEVQQMRLERQKTKGTWVYNDVTNTARLVYEV